MKITIIEDDINLAENLAKILKKSWYMVSIHTSKEEFFNNYKNNNDIFIIDINLAWNNEWFDIIKWIRKNKKIASPIIITSWFNDIEKKIYWLDLWADDYLPKPYSIEELEARIRSLTRREANLRENIIKYKDTLYDLKSKSFISWVDKNIYFTKKELMIVEILLLNKNKIISRNKLITSAWWDYDWMGVKDNTINVTLFNLRNKLWESFDLHTIVWEGYILRE